MRLSIRQALRITGSGPSVAEETKSTRETELWLPRSLSLQAEKNALEN